MRARTHAVIGTAVAIALAPWLRSRSIPLWLGATLTDVDLYAYYVVRHRHFSPRRAVGYYKTLTGRREHARKLLHHPIVPIVAVAGARWFPGIAAFGAGIALHLSLDAYGKDRHRRVRRELERRSEGNCEACGTLQSAMALMEPRYVGQDGAKEDYDPANWRLLCRACNEMWEQATDDLPSHGH